MAALDAGNDELAELLMWQANDLFIDAIWSRIEPADIEFLANGAGRRGRRSSTAERNAELSQAVLMQEERGLKGKAARNAAFAANPDLRDAFSGATDEAIRKAISRFRGEQN